MMVQNIPHEPTRALPPISSVSRRPTRSAFGSAKESGGPISVWSGILSLSEQGQAPVLRKIEWPLGSSVTVHQMTCCPRRTNGAVYWINRWSWSSGGRSADPLADDDVNGAE